jgi:hypothetical protein
MSKQETGKQLDAQVTTAASPSGVPSIVKKMLQVMRKVGYVQKDGKNEFHGYKYASEANLIAALRPELIEAGLVLIPSVSHVSQDEHGNTHVLMLFTLMDDEGSTYSFCGAGSGNDRNKNGVGDKGIYKAITGATKYALMKTFLLETGDDPEVVSAHDQEKIEPVEKPKEKTKPKPKGLNEDQKLLVKALKEFAGNMGDEKELMELWGENLPKIEGIEAADPEAHDDLKQHFRTIRTKLKESK